MSIMTVPTSRALAKSEDRWSAGAFIVRTRKGHNAYLRRSAVSHFLKFVKGGSRIKYTDLPYDPDHFTVNDFYMIIDWMQAVGLSVSKEGTSYIFGKSIRAEIRAAWNEAIENLTFPP